MENLVMFAGAFQDKTVWLSGHTGFKGSWLAEWLLSLGAHVHGFSLPPPTNPALFEQLDLAERIAHHEIGDIRDASLVTHSIRSAQPDFVLHLAAQPLVRLSYEQPVETYATNVMGTIHVLEALRSLQKPCAAVFVTTDKCYENKEWVYGYREEDPLGGHDPYSSSKAAAEIAVAAYRQSFFENHPVKISSARAGNVIGGGDWALDRIVPDCVRALTNAQPIPVRNKYATRPWQHVLEPLGGYLWLAAAMADPDIARCSPAQLRSALNFGPDHDSNRTVQDLVIELLKHWPGQWQDQSNPDAVHEAKLLQLSTDKANALLGWTPTWTFATTVAETCNLYRVLCTSSSPDVVQQTVQQQIEHYHQRASALGRLWAK